VKHYAQQFNLPLIETLSLVGEREVSVRCLCGAPALRGGQCERCEAEIDAENAHRELFKD
jgi:methionyl-tRNA synthetase